MSRGRLDIARRADHRPAHEHFVGRVTASMIREHGSHEAARAALNSPKPADFPHVAAGQGEGED